MTAPNMMRRHQKAAISAGTMFSVHKTNEGGTKLRISCASADCEQYTLSGLPINVPLEVAIKHFRHRDWEIHPNGTSATCPICLRKKRARTHDPDSEIKKYQEKQAMSSLNGHGGGRRHPAQDHVKSARTAAPAVVKPPVIPATPAVEAMATQPVLRPLTAKETRQLHSLLENHFDEEKCRYRTGWSDQKVADTLNTVARIHVERVRSEAYGELKPAESEVLLNELVAIEVRFRDAMDKVRSDYEAAQAAVMKDFLHEAEQLREKISKISE